MRIANGYSTAIWGSAWIPEDGNFKVITPPPASLFSLQVADLINPMTGLWDSTFWEVNRDRILAIPLGTTLAEDRLVWHYSKNECFSIRSCYQFILQNFTSFAEHMVGSTNGVESCSWDEIWRLLVPPKICMFLWRTCVGILPYKVELFCRHITDNPFCESFDIGSSPFVGTVGVPWDECDLEQ